MHKILDLPQGIKNNLALEINKYFALVGNTPYENLRSIDSAVLEQNL